MKLSCKVREDLQIHNPKELESVFIERLIFNKPSLILGTIHKPLGCKFSNNIMKKLLNKARLGNKRGYWWLQLKSD